MSRKAPETYSEWMDCLNALKKGGDDEEVLRAMKAGTLSWQSGVAERFSRSLVNAVNERMNAATDRFQRKMRTGRGSDSDITRALLDLQREMRLLKDAVDLPAIPENYRRQYIAMVQDEAQKMQDSLEQSAKSDRTGRLSYLIRSHSVAGK